MEDCGEGKCVRLWTHDMKTATIKQVKKNWKWKKYEKR